jgi:hypothetical protein
MITRIGDRRSVVNASFDLSACVAVIAGARSFVAIAEWAAAARLVSSASRRRRRSAETSGLRNQLM